jgi:Tfp pilus assembly protein PilO
MEHRWFFVGLLAVLAANLGVYAGYIYPLASSVADADSRAAAAARARLDARRELDAVTGIARSRERAEAALLAFYRDVLPADLDAAHKLTYVDLAVRARQSNLTIARRTETPGHQRGSRFGRLDIGLTLEGRYEDIRRFVYGIEKAPGFLVIDDMVINPGRTPNELVLTMQLSTYYRVASDAS